MSPKHPPTHVHFETLTANPPVFQIAPAQIAAAKRRHPVVARQMTTSHGADLADMARWLPRVEVLVTSFTAIAEPGFPLRRLAAAAPRLRWIHLTSAGIDKVLPLDWLPPQVTLTNSSGIHSRKAGEYASMAMLMLHAGLPRLLAQQRAATWRQHFTPSIAGRTVAIIGLGGLGGSAAKQARHLGMTVLGVRRTPAAHPHVDRLYGFRNLRSALKRADIVYVAVPLTAVTHHLIDRRAFDAMKPGAALINVARAGVVDYDVLAEKLRDGSLSGAMLDVFDPEPLPASSPLWSVPNLIITPHVAMDEVDQYIPRALDLAFRNLRAFRAGRKLQNTIDVSLEY
ncbi:MAG: D-2-hydroxyacid dehydrogenase [Pseudomonadota bacterium]